MQRLPRALAILALLTALVAFACTTDAEDPTGTSPNEVTSTPTEAAKTSTPLALDQTATATPTPTPTQQRNFVGDLGDYPFVVLVEQDTADLLDNPPPDPVLTFEEVATPSEALERVEDIDAAGLILNATTYADFPIEDFTTLYDAGHVVVAFEVPLDELQLSLEFGRRVDEVDLPPSGVTMESPFYSLVHRTRPSVQPETGGATAQRLFPTVPEMAEAFHSNLARHSDIAAGRIRP